MRTFLIAVSISTFFVSCNEDEEPSGQDCAGVTICTEEFRTISVRVMDEDQPVALDNYKTVNLATNEIIDLQHDQIFEQGIYPVLTDAQFDMVDMEGTDFIFEGSVQDAVVVDQVFTIGHDCCHVVLIEGPETIQLQ